MVVIFVSMTESNGAIQANYFILPVRATGCSYIFLFWNTVDKAQKILYFNNRYQNQF